MKQTLLVSCVPQRRRPGCRARARLKARPGRAAHPIPAHATELTGLRRLDPALQPEPHPPGGPKKFRIPNDYRPTRTTNTDSGDTLTADMCQRAMIQPATGQDSNYRGANGPHLVSHSRHHLGSH